MKKWDMNVTSVNKIASDKVSKHKHKVSEYKASDKVSKHKTLMS